MSTEQAQWAFYDNGFEAIEDGVTRRNLNYYVADTDRDIRAAFWMRGDAERYCRERNREAGIPTETGDAHGEVEQNMRSRLDDLRTLTRAAEGAEDLSYGEIVALSALGVGESPPEGEEACDLSAEAGERLDEYPLCVEATTTFEVVIGTGGPDDRLCFECDAGPGPYQGETSYEIRRVLYRYSWTGSAERELTGEDRETAERFARRHVPELAE